LNAQCARVKSSRDKIGPRKIHDHVGSSRFKSYRRGAWCTLRIGVFLACHCYASSSCGSIRITLVIGGDRFPARLVMLKSAQYTMFAAGEQPSVTGLQACILVTTPVTSLPQSRLLEGPPGPSHPGPSKVLIVNAAATVKIPVTNCQRMVAIWEGPRGSLL
jgi:hypothetical protein